MLVSAVLALTLFGCSADGDAGEDRIIGLRNMVGGNPLVPLVAAYPFPSDLYLVPAETQTGRAVALTAEVAPEDLGPEVFASHDGFTRVPALLTWFPGGLDPTSLPDLEDSVSPESPIFLVREGTAEPVPLLVELDSLADAAEEQALILRPQITLEPNAGYAVLIRDSLRLANGSPPAIEEAFRALRDGIPTDMDAVEDQRTDFEIARQAIGALGLSPKEVVAGWTFHTRSEAQVVVPLMAAHDAVMSAPLGPWERVSDTDDGANRLVEGRITVPDFLDDSDRVVLDEANVPVQQGEREVSFLVTIPHTVTGPRPAVLYGHGFLSTMEEPTWSSLQQLIQPAALPTVSTDFLGLSEGDAIESIAMLAGSLTHLEVIASQQIQSHLHFTALARLVREQLGDDITDDQGGALLDTGRVRYMGISNGGTQGFVIVAGSPAIDRGVLVVPGGGWSHMMQRAVQWRELGMLVADKYRDPLELQLVISLTQNLLDPIDSLNFAPYLAGSPYPGRPPARISVHEAVEDSQVANMVTEWVARSAGISLITPSARPVWGLQKTTAPPPSGTDVDAALITYDEGYPQQPLGNQPPATDNGSHETIRDLAVYQQHVTAFIEDDRMIQVCDGPCDPD